LTAYDEQDELEKLKTWWKNYGTAVVIGVLLGVGALAGYRYWTQHQEQRLQEASALYQQLVLSLREKKTEVARETGTLLLKDFPGTPYGGMAGLLLARLDFDSGDLKAARARLQWVMDNARDPATANAARLRLARLLLGEGDKDGAAALLDVKDRAGFESEYDELRGDIYAAQGKREAARSAYREALKHLPADSPYVRVLNMKLDDLGTEQPS
jgi:predicted negative regulator of RcsB-dependent stress response